MAFVSVQGSNGIWEYDNAPTLGTLANANAKVQDDPDVGPTDQYYRSTAS